MVNLTATKILSALVLGGALTTGFAAQAIAGTFISNGTIQLGVNNEGHLNVEGGSPSLSGTSAVGLRFLPTNAEATAPGCLCEGWGVGDAGSGSAGFANVAVDGVQNLTPIDFTFTGDTATSVVNAAGGLFKVTHHYTPSTATSFLYEVLVSIENIGMFDVTDLRYRRVMDWDIEPTAFNEYVTIQGTADASNVLFASNDGFASANPLSGSASLGQTGDFVDAGAADHGALFDFGFGRLDQGQTRNFSIFYGAAPNEREAKAALGAVGAEVYSFGQPNGGERTGEPNTFIFAFKGVGGAPIEPPTSVPEPASLLGLSAVALFATKLRGQKQADS